MKGTVENVILVNKRQLVEVGGGITGDFSADDKKKGTMKSKGQKPQSRAL